MIKSWPYDKLQYGDLILDHATVAMVVETNPRYYLDVDLMQSLGPCKEVGPPNDSVQLVQITPITMVHGTYNYSSHGGYKPSNITGGPTLYGLEIEWFLETHKIWVAFSRLSLRHWKIANLFAWTEVLDSARI